MYCYIRCMEVYTTAKGVWRCILLHKVYGGVYCYMRCMLHKVYGGVYCYIKCMEVYTTAKGVYIYIYTTIGAALDTASRVVVLNTAA